MGRFILQAECFQCLRFGDTFLIKTLVFVEFIDHLNKLFLVYLLGKSLYNSSLWGGIGARILWLFFGLMASCLTLAGAMVAASRLAGQPGMEAHNNIGRLWHGMGILKWGLVLFVLAVSVLVVLRFGPF